ncbi:hypothetical protein [Spiroplasma phoeniceum]|uniref:Uncharacterized protein n=1 Tax=Spiroplasma phoeniceum P40 TaxID=1276259 RepID=A0A345DQF1_9MOLU|nr:hypothetical protein [Spiroplasma phoeniceum]AXF96442.1 hypothetical protein SDAV_001475 [Spiroplasma phoeniceum P40]
MAKYCKKCQCPVNQINSDYCLFCDNDVLKEELTELNKDLNWSLKTEEVLNKMFEDKIEENEALEAENDELKQQILYKEDFYLLCEEDKLTYDWESLQTDEITIEMHLKYCESNNHRYCLIKDINNLPSKEGE